VTAYVLHAVQAFKGKTKNKDDRCNPTSIDLAHAEALWAKESQVCLAEEPKSASWKKEFGLFLDPGVWRCGGRLLNADVSYTTKHPALLHKDHHHLTKLLILRAHSKCSTME